jgi:formylmethanofuran dehydrogenase subunit E
MTSLRTIPSLDEVTQFHGHCCPGLALGYRIAVTALDTLGGGRAPDEELVAVVENDSCAVDAIQVVTGCTFGKGNFLHRPYGKHVYTFYRRETGEGIRIAENYRGFEEDSELGILRMRLSAHEATPEEEARFREKMREKTDAILRAPVESFLTVTPAKHLMPGRARIEPSERCATCGETVMASRLVDVEGKKRCLECK